METFENLKDLLAENVNRLYNGAQYSKTQLPVIQRFVRSPQLKNLIRRKIVMADTQQDYLNELMKILEVDLDKSKRNRIVKHIIESAKTLTEKSANDQIKEAAVLGYLKQLSHYEQAEYGTVCSYTGILGLSLSAHDFHELLAEEREVNLQLMLLAENNLSFATDQIMKD